VGDKHALAANPQPFCLDDDFPKSGPTPPRFASFFANDALILRLHYRILAVHPPEAVAGAVGEAGKRVGCALIG